MAESSPLSGVNVVLVMAYGSLVSSVTTSLDACLGISWLSCWEPATLIKYLFFQVFVLLFIFVKRQIMRFAMRSRRGPHAPIGHNATKVKQIIKRARVGEQCGDTYWMCLSRVWKRTLIPGFPGSRKSASNLASCQRKTIVWSRDHKLVSHLIITVTCPSSVVKLKLPFYSKGCYNYLYRMKALDAIRDSGQSSARWFGRFLSSWGDFLIYL